MNSVLEWIIGIVAAEVYTSKNRVEALFDSPKPAGIMAHLLGQLGLGQCQPGSAIVHLVECPRRWPLANDKR